MRDTDPELWQQLKPLFAAARNLPPEQWDAYARAHCGPNGALRRELLALLAADRRAPDDFLGSSFAASSAGTLAPGQVLAGRFRILAFLGEGGMGQVYAAEDLELGEKVAVKRLLPSIARDERLFGRFKREVLLARQVTHPNVCRVYDLFFDLPGPHPRASDSPLAFVSMELLAGETLADRLAKQAPLALDEALDIARQVAAGLAAGHRAGIVHRDLKSANILLAGTPAGRRAVVADFGIAVSVTAARGDRLTAEGDLLGTPGYMAPEQLEGGPVGPATDVYAFGVVVFEMVTGTLPFSGRTALATALQRFRTPPPKPRRLRPELPAPWERVILRCLQRDPAARFCSAAELAEALDRLPAESRPPRRRLHRGGLAWAALLALLAAAPPMFWWRPWDTAPAPRPAVRLYEDGMSSLRRFEAVRARDRLREAALADPSNALVHSALAEAWAALGYEERADEEARRAFQLSSGLPREEQWRIEAGYHEVRHDFAAAAQLFAKLRRRFPGDLEPGLRLAAALRETGRPGEALRIVDELRRLPAPLSADPRLDLEEARAAGAFSFERQQKAAERAQARAEAIQAHEMAAEALTLQGQARHRRGDPAGALTVLARAGTIYRAAGQPLGLARLLLVTSAVHRETGERDQAEKLLQEARTSFRALHNRSGEAAVLCDLAQCLTDRGDLPAARKTLEEALALAREARATADLLTAERRLGSILRQQGDFEAAQSHFEAGLALARSTGHRNEELRLLNSLAFLFKIQGDFLHAEEKLRASSAGLENAGDKAGAANATSNLGIVLAAQGKLAEAEACHIKAFAAYRDVRSLDKMAEELHRLAEVHRYQGRDGDAWKEHQEALSLRHRLGHAGAVARSRLALGKLLLDRGRPGESEAMLREAARELQQADARDFAAEALTAMAAAAWDAGRRDEARKTLEHARELAGQSRDASVSLYFALVEARLAAAAGAYPRGEDRLRTALAQARGAGLPLEMEARLLLARIRLASGPPDAARSELAALLAEAEEHGITLVSRQARNLLAGTGSPASP